MRLEQEPDDVIEGEDESDRRRGDQRSVEDSARDGRNQQIENMTSHDCLSQNGGEGRPEASSDRRFAGSVTRFGFRRPA